MKPRHALPPLPALLVVCIAQAAFAQAPPTGEPPAAAPPPPPPAAPPPGGIQYAQPQPAGPPPGQPPPGYGPPAAPPPSYGAPPPYAQHGYGQPAPLPPPPPSDPTVHFHDGFFFQLALGVGAFSDSIKDGDLEATASGTAFTGGLLLGGTPSPGLVVGGGTAGAYVSSVKLESGGNTVEPDDFVLNAGVFGPFIDYYFDPTSGLHLHGMIGFGNMTASGADANEDFVATGPGAVVGIGYEGWIGEQWGLGGLLRVMYLSLNYSEGNDDEDHTVVVPGLLLTVTHH